MTRLFAVMIGLLALVGCAAPAPTDYAAEHKPVVDGFMTAWNAGNLDGLDAVIAPDFQRLSPGGLATEGLEAFKQVVATLRTGYPDMQVVLDDSRYMQDRSYHLWTFTGTNTGPGDVPPTGKSVKLTGSTRMLYRDGKIVEELVYFDALDWHLQLGYTLLPPAFDLSAPAAQ